MVCARKSKILDLSARTTSWGWEGVLSAIGLVTTAGPKEKTEVASCGDRHEYGAVSADQETSHWVEKGSFKWFPKELQYIACLR